MNIQKSTTYLRAHHIVKYLLGDEGLDTRVTCSNESFVTTDQSLYEALGSIDDKSKINFFKLVKLLEVCKIQSFEESMNQPRKILTDSRVEEIKQQVEK